MGSICKTNNSAQIKINGVQDHVHVLCILSKNISIAKLVEEIKRHSSRWIKTLDIYYKDFSWQSGYAGFSVSPSKIRKTKNYIAKQEIHHKKLSFKEEYIMFLKEYNIEYSEEYLWSDE